MEQNQSAALFKAHIRRARQSVPEYPLDIAARLFMLHGATIIPSVGKEPLDMAAAIFSGS